MASVFGNLNNNYYNDYRNFGLTNIMANPLVTLNMIKQPDGSVVVEAYEDKYKQVYHLIYKEADGIYLYVLKDIRGNIIHKIRCDNLSAAKNEMLYSQDNGRWFGEKEMYAKNHLNPVKVVEHELTYEPTYTSSYTPKKSFKQQLIEEISGWCKGILNVSY